MYTQHIAWQLVSMSIFAIYLSNANRFVEIIPFQRLKSVCFCSGGDGVLATFLLFCWLFYDWRHSTCHTIQMQYIKCNMMYNFFFHDKSQWRQSSSSPFHMCVAVGCDSKYEQTCTYFCLIHTNLHAIVADTHKRKNPICTNLIYLAPANCLISEIIDVQLDWIE